MRRWMGVLLFLAACGGDEGSPLTTGLTLPVTVTVELLDDVPTFKVDGRLDVTLERLPPFGGSVELGVGVLPAGARTATFTVEVPFAGGRLQIRERTFHDRTPFLCGDALVDPGTGAAVLVALDLCLP